MILSFSFFLNFTIKDIYLHLLIAIFFNHYFEKFKIEILFTELI